MRYRFNIKQFHKKINDSIETIKKIIETNKSFQLPENVSHSYDDKFFLSEFVTNIALSSHLNTLSIIGFNDEIIEKMKIWKNENKKSITLRFNSEEKCYFLKEKKIEKQISRPIPTHMLSDRLLKLQNKESAYYELFTYTTIDYYWIFEFNYQIIVFPGNESSDAITISSKIGKTTVKTSYNQNPYPSSSVNSPIDCNITWLLNQLNKTNTFNFSIDRNLSSCRTPKNNESIFNSLDYFNEFYTWSESIQRYFKNHLFVINREKLDLSSLNASEIFLPVLPLFDTSCEGSFGNIFF